VTASVIFSAYTNGILLFSKISPNCFLVVQIKTPAIHFFLYIVQRCQNVSHLSTHQAIIITSFSKLLRAALSDCDDVDLLSS
jgi:hypothetical protein